MVKTVMLRFDKFLHATEKAYLIRVGHSEHWIAKKLCRNLVINKKLGGNVVIPAFKYQEITGVDLQELSESELIGIAETIIVKHVPERIEPIESKADESLTR